MSAWLRRSVLRNFPLKVLSLALAVLLYILVRPANHPKIRRGKAAATRTKQPTDAATSKTGAMDGSLSLDRGAKQAVRSPDPRPVSAPSAPPASRPTSQPVARPPEPEG